MMLIAALALAAELPAKTDCSYDHTVQMALAQEKFDQDIHGGWRALANKGCTLEAAALIRDWRIAHQSTDPILFWHEGQVRALANQNAEAIALFGLSRKPAAEDHWGWNLYVDGSIAFLRGDRLELKTARAKLAALPKPEDWPPIGADGKPMAITWPMNLNVLDKLLHCWGRPYKQAYGLCTAVKQ